MALTLFPTSKYWFDKKALVITPNALDRPDFIQASASNNAVIMAHMDGIDGLDYDAGHNYRRWQLVASPTFFATHTAKYVYIAIPRPSSDKEDDTNGTAKVVFPSKLVDIYGKNEAGEQLYPDDCYYLFTNGILTSSGEDGDIPRDWDIDHEIISGTLHTDYGNDNPTDSEWYKYDALNNLVIFLKNLTLQAGVRFLNLYVRTLSVIKGGKLTFGDANEEGAYPDGEITKVADFASLSDDTATEIVTPHYLHNREAEVEKKYLRKDQDDETEFGLTVASLKSNGTVDVFGNFVAEKEAKVFGNFVAEKDTTHKGASTWGVFNKDLITGTGAQIDKDGNAVFDSVGVRKYLEAAELRLRRTRIYSGVDWHTVGCGEIESVEQTDATHGIITLKLESGEAGAIAVGDKCMGIFHNETGNATSYSDDRKGNIEFAGFSTSYFMVTSLLPEDHRKFVYTLRPLSARWTKLIHPSPKMAFAAYANAIDKSRQSCRLTTPEYDIWLENMTDWEFSPNNYFQISGNLEGFSIMAVNQAGNPFVKSLHGKGTALGNVYMYGNVDQFTRLADRVELSVSPLVNNDFSIADNEIMYITPQMLSFDGIKRTDVSYRVERNTNDSVLDAEWNEQRGRYFNDDGAFELTVADLNGNDVVAFTFYAERNIESESGTEIYSISTEATVRFAKRYSITADKGENAFLDSTGGMTVNFYAFDMRQNRDVTSEVSGWHIERDSGDTSADEVWNNSSRALAFEIPTPNKSFKFLDSDIPANSENTRFKVYANIDPGTPIIMDDL